MILINGIPASKELVTSFSMVKGATLENPVKTKDLKNATGLSERMIRDGINNLRFTYSVPIGSIRQATNNGYYFIRNQDDLIATIAPIKAQAKQELNVINKLKDNLKNWSDERWQHNTLNLIQYITLIFLSVLTGYTLHGIIDAIKDGTFFD